ncbi:MAG: hypothetical protein QOI27_463, partial [Gaiellaceae bacterium]|nr:hypothetical protein [Gaiellaceae bacterium]
RLRMDTRDATRRSIALPYFERPDVVWRARGDAPDQAGRTGRALEIAVPTFKPDPGEMRRVWCTSRGCVNARSGL